MKLSDFDRIDQLRRARDHAITSHNYLSGAPRPLIKVGGTECSEAWSLIKPVLLDYWRNEIEQAETDLKDLGVEVESHFAPIDPPATPLTPLADELTRRGYTLLETGGGCKAWVKVMEDNQNVVVTDQNGTGKVDWNDWIVGRYPGDDWSDGNASSSDEGEFDTIWDAIFIHEGTPYVPATATEG